MNVFDKVRNVDNQEITGIVVEITDITVVKANSDMSTVSTTETTKMKILSFPAMSVISGNLDDWDLIA
jgi:hypothetical protein